MKVDEENKIREREPKIIQADNMIIVQCYGHHLTVNNLTSLCEPLIHMVSLEEEFKIYGYYQTVTRDIILEGDETNRVDTLNQFEDPILDPWTAKFKASMDKVAKIEEDNLKMQEIQDSVDLIKFATQNPIITGGVSAVAGTDDAARRILFMQ